jgi:hypothetical protein
MSTGANRPEVGGDAVRPSVAVLEAVSDSVGTPAVELPTLNDAIDPDALDELFSGRRTSGRVTFRYAGRRVTVHADRTVDVSAGD